MKKKRKTATTPEERARWAENQHRLLLAIQRRDQRLENDRAAREGRAPLTIPFRIPSSEEARQALETAIARNEARAEKSA
jgi:hypothetical protein